MDFWPEGTGTIVGSHYRRPIERSHEPSTRRPQPEDLTRLFVERANAGDAAGIAVLYEEDAVMAYPPGQPTVGREAIRALWEEVLANGPHFEPEEPLPTLRSGDLALTSTPPKDGRRPGPGRAPPARRHLAPGARPARVRGGCRRLTLGRSDRRGQPLRSVAGGTRTAPSPAGPSGGGRSRTRTWDLFLIREAL